MSILTKAAGWFRWGGSALDDKPGRQTGIPSASLVDDAQNIGVDRALQISAVWACVARRATTVASLPMFAYLTDADGQRKLARDSSLWRLLHESPNSRMTVYEFWVAMMLNHDLRGNAYARIQRGPKGEAVALWPMPADCVEVALQADGSTVYKYTVGQDVFIYAQASVLHLKNLGNGTIGLPKLEYMRPTTTEAQTAQQQANRMFGSSGKPTGLLMIDKLLKKEQREQIKTEFAGMAAGNSSRLFVLEADMKYQQLSLSPEDQQLLESRQFTIEEICRWFDVPPVLVFHSNVTTWGTGVEQIIDGFHKFSVRPMLVSIEQAIRRSVMTPAQRSTMTAEFNFDALLRASLKDRMEIYAKAVQNGIYSRNQARQLENDPPYAGGDVFTAQTNLAPVDMLGKLPPGRNVPAEPVQQ